VAAPEEPAKPEETDDDKTNDDTSDDEILGFGKPATIAALIILFTLLIVCAITVYSVYLKNR
jgi:hypothetical protein